MVHQSLPIGPWFLCWSLSGNDVHLEFEDDPTVLYISIHQYEGRTFYASGELGGPNCVERMFLIPEPSNPQMSITADRSIT